MHSKFLKFQTVFLTLAVLFTSVLVPNQVQALESGSASNAAQAAAITDPNTFDAWYKIQGNNTSAIGRIWADKTVEADSIQFTTGKLKDQSVKKSAGSDFLVALSAMSSTSSTTQAEPIPLDVVMVLDASGSMSEDMGTTTRIDALKAAVSNFVDSAAAKNAQISDADKKIRLSIVKFAGDKSDSIGNDTDRNGYNYSQIMQELTVCEGRGAQQLKTTVKSIDPAGATQADYGLERAQAALTKARRNAKKVVIFFTDGSPNSFSGFESKVAASAIGTAKDIKATGTEVYTVGIFEGANPSANVSSTSLENKFMHAVSSNYPNATYTPGLWNYTFNWGTAAANPNYYLAATSADGLNSVFEGIFRSVATNLTGPTLIEENRDPSSGGYVTFDDTLGSFMEVKAFNGIALSDRIYTTIEKTTNGNVDTYVCTDQVTGPVSPAYPQHADLRKVLITVTRGTDSKTGDRVRVRIPASMLPLRHFDLQRDAGGNVTSLNVTDTYPIRVLYSVGLKDEVRDDLEAGTSTDPDLVKYVADNAVDGEIHFYSNAYTGQKNSEDITIGDTTASFVPALNNSFYYYTQDTPLYMDKACTKPVTNFQKGQTYYYKLEYYSNQTAPTYGFSAIPISISADQDDSVIVQNNGQAYVRKGTKKGSMPRAIDDQLGNKSENTTETATRRIDYDWDLQNGMSYLHLGNNGRLTYEAKGNLKITKQVQAADGLNPAADTAFTMKVNLTDSADKALPGSYSYTVDGTAAGSITNGGTITLTNGQTAEIEGLPAGAKYAVREINVPAWYHAVTDNGNGVITAGRVNDTAPVVTVTNTYAPAAYSMEKAFPGSKTLNGRSWKDGDSYRFLLEAISPADAPLPAPVATDAAGTRYSQIDVTAADGTPAGKPINFNFGNVTFTEPGTYEYNIREYTPSTEDRIPGVSYDETVYRATVVITDNGQGQLMLGRYTLKEIVQENGTTNTTNGNVAAFTNTFNANDEVINFKALKRYVDTSGATRLADDQFHFTLERATKDNLNQPVTTPKAPMPSAEGCNPTNTAGGEITFGNITYGTADIGKTYWYTIKEVPGNEPNMVYSNAEYLAKVDVTLEDTDTYAGISYFVKQDDGSWTLLEGSGDNTPVVFENTYTPTAASATLQLTKDLKGRDWADSDEFTFTLSGDEVNTPMPDGNATVAVTRSTTDHKAAFGAITYRQVGTYQYTITEQDKKIPGVAIDAPVTATVTVSHENGALKADVAYSRGTDSAAFTNTYTAAPYEAPASALFKVSKTLTGRDWTDNDTFEFTLTGEGNAPLPPSNQCKASVNRESTTTTFGNTVLTFNAAGDYVYYITEEPGSIAGVTYDTTKYKVVVSVTDDGTGTLTGTTRYYRVVDGDQVPVEGTVAAFTNTFNANDEVINFKALKRYVDNSGATQLADGQFHFTLERAATDNLNQTVTTQAPMPSAEGCNPTNTAGGEITFGNITYGTADIGKTYWYTIKEVPGSEPNMVYSNAEYLAKVDVTLENTDTHAGISYYVKQADGSWKPLEGSGDNTPVVFENTYTPTAASATLQLTKTLTGRNWTADDAFEFTLTGEENAPMPAGNATVTVKGSTEGHKAAFGAITYQQVGTYRYTITEQATNIPGVAIDTPVTATVTVSYENGALKAAVAYSRGTDSASFTNAYTAAPTDVTLTAQKTLNVESGSWALQGNDFSFALYDNADCTGTPLRTATNTADGSITFEALRFDTAGAYTYYMREVPGDRTAITYDSTVYKVTITVQDNGTGALTALPPVYTLNDEAMVAAKFVNTYTATPGDDTFTLTINKLLNGRAMNAGEFSFELTDSTGAVVSTGTNAADGTVTFSPVGLKAAQEQYSAFLASLPAAVEPEATATPEPTATPEATAVPEATPEATAEPEPTAAPEVTAQPEATAEPDPTAAPETTPAPEASALPQADGMAAAPMSLVVAPLAAGTQEIQPDFGPDDGIAPDLLQRWYTITEVNTGKTGVTYDSTVYKVLVPLKDSGDGSGTLVVDDEHIQYYRVVDGELAPVDGVTFTNRYAPLSTRVTLEGSKKLNGRALAADEFTFELCSADGTKVLSTATNQADGSFSFAPLAFDAAGTYNYTVREKNTGAARVTYDQTVYTVTVTVVDKDGQLTAEVALPDGGLTFTNSYAPLPTSVTLEGSKKLNGRALAADEFTFELCSADGRTVLSTAANQANGRFSFAPLPFDAEGTYTYTVREKNTGAARVTYDQTVYTVTVVVRNKDGQLTAEVALPDGGLTFTNTYTPKPDHKDKPKQTPAPTSTAQPAAPTQSPRTGDNASLMTWVGLLLVCGTALAGLYVYKKRKQK